MNESTKTEIIERMPTGGAVEAIPAPQSELGALISIIERAARDPSVDIDKLQRLMDMQERIMMRNAKMAYATSLAAMQPKLPVVNRKGRIEVRKKTASGERDGEIQQSTAYALWEDINEAIRPSLAEHGFALSFRVGQSQDGKITVTGILSHREGHSEETTITLQHDSTGSKNAVQAVGSSVSYGKRYTAGALLNFTSRGEDDDGKAGGDPSPINPEQLSELIVLADDVGADKAKFCGVMKVPSFAEIPASRFEEAKKLLNKKKQKAQQS